MRNDTEIPKLISREQRAVASNCGSRRVHFAIAVWGEAYVGTMLSLAIPSFLAPGNIPACATHGPVNFTIVTRPEDAGCIGEHPIIRELQCFATVSIVPLLTEDKFVEANRYDVMALCHRHAIAKSFCDRAIISILSPDCVVSDGSLSFGLERIYEGYPAVLVAGPRATLEEVASRIGAFQHDSGGAVAIPSQDLASLATQHPHNISKLLYWNARAFSLFPSALYWRASSDSFLAKYFHLHPLFVDLAVADAGASTSGTIDGTLLSVAGIDNADVFVSTRSDDMCVVELSSGSHDPMGAKPHVVRNKTIFVGKWVIAATDRSHRAQFLAHSFRFQGREPVDWDAVEALAVRETALLARWLKIIDRLPLEGRFDRFKLSVRSQVRQFMSKASTVLSRLGWRSPRPQRGITGFYTVTEKLLVISLTPGPAVFVARIGWLLSTIGAQGLGWMGALYGRLRATRIDCSHLSLWANRSLFMPSHIQDHLLDHFQNYFETRVLPRRAQSLGLFSKFLYRVLRAFRVIFVVNVAPGTGHNTVEMDYFLRRQADGELDNRYRYVLLRLPNVFHSDTMSLYKKQFWWVSDSRLLYNLVMPVVAAHPELIIDCGLSRLKWQLKDDGSFSTPPQGQSFLNQIDKAENREAWKSYYRLRQRTRHLHPLKQGLPLDPELLTFLGGETDRLALLHVKQHVANATAAPSDPQSYLGAIQHLRDQGFRVVQVGREPMPPEFAAAGVLNYAESPVASYRHDLQLFGLAKVAITAGSGIALIPDCMGVPLVYLDSWHLGMPMASPTCVSVPALIADRKTGELLSLREQLDLYFDLEDRGDEIFPRDRYLPRNASSDEVEAAVREVLQLAQNEVPLSILQKAFLDLDQSGVGPLSESRISEYFLQKHRNLLADRVQRQESNDEQRSRRR